VDFNLLSQNLLLVVCGAVVALTVYLITQLGKPDKKAKNTKNEQKKREKRVIKELLIILVVAIIVSASFKLFIAHETDSGLPGAFLVMILPAVFSAGLLTLIIRNRLKLHTVGAISLVCSVLFSLLLINNYYRFYPTLGEVFNKNDMVASLNASQKEVNLQYTPNSQQATSNTQSIEGSLASLDKQPTAGKVYSLNIPGTVSKFKARTAYVYVPAIYNNPTKINLPVIILTAGFPGLTENWLGSGLEATMDTFATHHDGITPLVFMVDNTGSLTNDTECVNSPRGNVETYLTVDVPNYIEKNFDVEAGPSHWAIGGLSMGGTCAIMLALGHPDVYHYFLDYGGEMGPEIGSQTQTIKALFGGSESAWQEHQPQYLLATKTYRNMGGFFGVGNQDERDVTQAAYELSGDSKKAGIETVYEVIGGQHTFNVWQDAFKLSLPWVSNRIGATSCGTTCL
jgi:S-formylglutathione hydrolase FrmB